MAAIITDDFRRNQARLLVDDINDASGGYALGIGKSDPWPDDINDAAETETSFIVTSPEGTILETKDVIDNLIALKEAEKANQIIPKNAWATGRTYKSYDQNDSACFYATGVEYPCVVTYNNNIYICLSNSSKNGASEATGVSTVAPNASTDAIFFNSSDGYVWAHVQEINTTGTYSNFITSQFVPIEDNADPTTATTNQGGILYDIALLNGGDGYTGTPTATLELVDVNGDTIDTPSVTLGVQKSGNSISNIYINVSTNGSYGYWSNGNLWVKGAVRGTVTITGGNGTGAIAIPLIGPALGFAGVPKSVTPSWFIGVSSQFDGTENNQFPTEISFRQISLLRNFTESSVDDSITALKYLTLINPNTSVISNTLNAGDILEADNGAKFYFNYYNAGTSRLYYHQNSNSEVNFILPDGAITYSSSGDVASGSTSGSSEYVKEDGDVLFHENRKPFARNISQTEEINMIIQL